MKKNEIISALEGVDQKNLEGTSRLKEITVQFAEGIPVRLIAEKFELSTSRVSQIAAKQARRALLHKKQANDPLYQSLVEEYSQKMLLGESISISSELGNTSTHLMAVMAARKKTKGEDEP